MLFVLFGPANIEFHIPYSSSVNVLSYDSTILNGPNVKGNIMLYDYPLSRSVAQAISGANGCKHTVRR